MKKILLVNDHNHFSGGGDAVLKLEKTALENKGYQVYTYSFTDKAKKSEESDFFYIESESLLNKKLRKFVSYREVECSFKSCLDEVKPDLVHIHLVSKYPASIYSQLSNYKTIQTLHGPNLFCATSWGGLKDSAPCELGISMKCFTRGCTNFTTTLLYKNLYDNYISDLKGNVNLFHAPSRQLYSSIKRLGLGSSVYLPLGIDRIFHEEVEKTENERPTLLYVGAVAEQKGIKTLIKAMPKIVEQHPSVILKIAGKGELTSWVEKEIEINALQKNVMLLGFVNRDTVRKLYIEADLFVLPSVWHEQFGLVGPEALACKTPCIGSNIGGIPEWLHHNQWGYVVPPNQESDLASSIIELINDPNKRRIFGERGREFVLSEYSSYKYEESIIRIIEDMLDE